MVQAYYGTLKPYKKHQNHINNIEISFVQINLP
jgi:hypothetical protein